MAAVPLAIAGLAGLAGIFGNQPKTTTNKTDQTSTQNQSGTSSITPTYDPQTQALRDALIGAYGNSINEDVDLSGYQAQGQSQINQAGDARTQAIQNSLASRGLSYSPVASYAPAMSESARIGDTATFLNSIPLLQRQLRDQRLSAASNFLHGLPVGQSGISSQTGTQHVVGSGEVTAPGNMLGGGLAGLSTTLAGLYGSGAFGGGNNSPQYGVNRGPIG